MCRACLPARLLWMVRECPAVSIWNSFLWGYSVSQRIPQSSTWLSAFWKQGRQRRLGWRERLNPKCVEFSLLLLSPASRLTLIAGCPASAERLFNLSREKSLIGLPASALASPPVCFQLRAGMVLLKCGSDQVIPLLKILRCFSISTELKTKGPLPSMLTSCLITFPFSLTPFQPCWPPYCH